jgi:hypothetical protein
LSRRNGLDPKPTVRDHWSGSRWGSNLEVLDDGRTSKDIDSETSLLVTAADLNGVGRRRQRKRNRGHSRGTATNPHL